MITDMIEDKSLVVDLPSALFNRNLIVKNAVMQDGKRKERIRRLMEYCFIQNSKGYPSGGHNACALILFPEQEKVSFQSVLSDLKLLFFCIVRERLQMVLSRELKVKKSPGHSVFWFVEGHPHFGEMEQIAH